MTNEPFWVEEEAVVQIHQRQIDEHGGSAGIRDRGLLSSALARPRHLYAYQPGASMAALAAAYAVGVVKNHPFVDGNKRTGAVLCETFLNLNGYSLVAEDDEWCDIILNLAAGNLAEEQLREWLNSRIAPS